MLDVLAGRRSREETASWASQWVTESDPGVDDLIAWEALNQLAGVDLRVSRVDYLHSETDIHEWLDRLEESGPA